MGTNFFIYMLWTCSYLSSIIDSITFNFHFSITDNPDGFWFGTQSLLCVMGMTGSASSGRKRRDVMSPSRYSLRFSHRVLYYRGALYEWGTGTLGYFIGTAPSVVECDIKWEEEPTGNSTCLPATIEEFTYDYRSVSMPQ